MQVCWLVIVSRLLDVYLLVEPSLVDAPGVPLYHVAAAVLVVVGTIAFAQSRPPRTQPRRRSERVATQ